MASDLAVNPRLDFHGFNY